MADTSNVKEQRIRKIILSYYSRPDIRKNMLDFAKNRECVPRYFEGFGKRPDAFQYESDILELTRKGATSFHCSEELWKEPLELSIGLNEEQLNELRQGWDLLIDIDSKYLDYSKIYAELLINILKSHGVENIGVKFSGSKGFHIIIPWKAFPEEMSGKKTKDLFPDWPRLICKYLSDKLANQLKERILDLDISQKDQKQKKQDLLEVCCINCGSPSNQEYKIFFICPACRTESETMDSVIKRKRKIRCPNCTTEMIEIRREELYVCHTCNLNSKTTPANFKEKVKKQHIDADIVLVSPRHLFRMPYSLHEKTSLASVVIDKDKIKDFDIKEAFPLKVKVKDFIPDSKPGEAAELLREAIDYAPIETEEEIKQTTNFGKKKFKDITIDNLTPDLYPPSIKKILEGMKSDGRKRALFILLNFFNSLKLEDQEIKNIIEEWNKKI